MAKIGLIYGVAECAWPMAVTGLMVLVTEIRDPVAHQGVPSDSRNWFGKQGLKALEY